MASLPKSPSNAYRNVLAVAIAACLGLADGAGAATTAGAYVSLDEVAPGAETPRDQRLFLEVFHDERPINRIAELRLRDHRLWGTPAELVEIGLELPANVAADGDGLIPLDALPGLGWRYDTAAQRLYLNIPVALRPQQTLGYQTPPPVQAERPNGWRLGYDAYGRHRENIDTLAVATSLNWFGRWGALELDGVTHFADVVEGGTGRGFERLDSRWTYSDPDRLWSWTVGDLVNGGVGWSRPVRMGGVQWRRNFAVRPDLVTIPLPRFSADATLPSAVELYVDNVQQFGSEVQDGPFVLDAMPSINGAGMAQLVVRDSLGRVTTTTVPLYVDNQRLAAGLTDFSFEAGVLRRGYGSAFDEYGDDVAASASWRRGATDNLTVEAHAETTDGLALAGAGLVWSPGNRWGLLNASYSLNGGDEDGWQRSAGYQYDTRYWGLDLQSVRRSEGFRDLGDFSVAEGALPTSFRAEDRATFWVPTPAGSFALSLIRWRDREGQGRTVQSVTWNRQFGQDLYLSASFFNDDGDRGGGINLSIPLGNQMYTSLSVQHSDSGTETSATLSRTTPYEGGWGWLVQASDRFDGQGSAQADYRGRTVETGFGVDYDGRATGAFAQAAGSIVGLGGETFLSRTVYDAFALVSAGIEGVPVLYENRVYGHTNADGHLLVTELRGWQRNRLAIDPDMLPANYRLGEIERFATPTDRGAALVSFDIERMSPALARLLGPEGTPLDAGRVLNDDSGATLRVGFEGTVYLESLDRDTVLEATFDDGTCRYSLPATPASADGTPTRIGSVACNWRPR